jgi:galactokinase
MCCVAGHVLFLDVRSGHTEQVPFDAAGSGLRVLVIDTRVKHAHSDSGYGDRRRGTERAAELLRVPALRDISLEQLPSALATLPFELQRLVRHVVTENARVLQVVDHLRAGRVHEIGSVLDASHESLREDYRVSCRELDLAVDLARDAGALGARMTGGGFGGSAIALVRDTDHGAVEKAIVTGFERAGLRRPRVFAAVPSKGAGRD